MKKCTHKTARDHIVATSPDRVRIWRCTGCKAEGRWTKDWLYYGNIECRACHETSMERVLCPTCAKPHQASVIA